METDLQKLEYLYDRCYDVDQGRDSEAAYGPFADELTEMPASRDNSPRSATFLRTTVVIDQSTALLSWR